MSQNGVKAAKLAMQESLGLRRDLPDALHIARTIEASEEFEGTVRRQLELLGENPDREGLKATPGRVHRAWLELTAGYQQDPAAILSTQFGDGSPGGIISVGPIPFCSLCEHHLLPFEGDVWLSYIPSGGRIVGLSKIPRLVECFARRLQVQERLNRQLVESFCEHLSPVGCIVRIRSRHSCMRIRGARCAEGEMTTQEIRGVFLSDPAARSEALGLF